MRMDHSGPCESAKNLANGRTFLLANAVPGAFALIS
jgi:hypothetical protein